ncbi:Ureide permease 2 [Dichanthelium oligosanthes]|uniref:Ureide permease 2 n=1 Tax=Dichanthelium oligosanthes TaxID=888268 RepID=A0A1E5VXE9_9POAL|nr:Ureide permease 2 [Dichanthelium oligosanthes]
MPVTVEDSSGAVTMMLASLFLLGTWPALLTLLERRGRLPQHTYLDYSVTNLLAAVLIAVALGKPGESRPGMPSFFTQLSQVFGSHKLLGLSLVFFAGACFSLFSPAINRAINDQWHALFSPAINLAINALRKGVPHLAVYTAFFYFSVSCLALGVCLNVWFLYHPMAGVPASTVGAYARDRNGRHWALLAGLPCGFGNGFQFMGGQAAGYTAVDAVQVSTLSELQTPDYLPEQPVCISNWSPCCELVISTFWGLVLFGEYRRASRKTYLLLGAMLLMFVIAVVVLMALAGHRKAVDPNAKFIVMRLHHSSRHPTLN